METQNQFYGPTPQKALPNATAVLVLGIISILGCSCYGILGLICGVIALVLANKDLQLYNAEPGAYTPGSYSNLKGGRICAIIGLIISLVYIVIIVIAIATIGFEALRHPQSFMTH